ncbi:MAG: hypothetical protein ACW99G_20350, partial [Candidatus Thorarchaeota archaeon]|jgi:hypothetical protein
MALDPTAREANVWDSIKKYFIDGLSYQVSFDKALSAPDLQGKTVDRWVSFVLDEMVMGDLSTILLSIYCCTRQDNEWHKLSQVRDTVYDLLIDTTKTDTMRRIPFYASHPTNPWTLIGTLLVDEITESSRMEAEDETKFKILHIRLRTASKV